ncbi:GntR family transcriptional regulator, partial [Lachnospiraceae bacterium OttesenSCG-928-D06]|nr:GntR family transcriptional regulator [Lachnospiraceae bacterium OttesenSCG-928-D06]
MYAIQLDGYVYKKQKDVLTFKSTVTILKRKRQKIQQKQSDNGELQMEDNRTKYQILKDFICNLVQEGKLKPGDKLYSENELCDMFHFSRQTVRKATKLLEEEGVLVKIKGSGTYIKDQSRENEKRRKRIAVVTTYVEGYIFPKTIQGIEKVLSGAGYSVQIAFTDNTLERERMILQDIINEDEVAGII